MYVSSLKAEAGGRMPKVYFSILKYPFPLQLRDAHSGGWEAPRKPRNVTIIAHQSAIASQQSESGSWLHSILPSPMPVATIHTSVLTCVDLID